MSRSHVESEPDEIEAIIGSIERSPIATIITDNREPNNPIIAANGAFVELTGYRKTEILGRNCRFLSGPATEPEARSALRDAVTAGRPAVVEITNYRKDGEPFRNAVMIAPVRDRTGAIKLFIGSQMNVHSTAVGSGLRSTRSRRRVDGLAPRLRQVLELMAIGYRNKQIGDVLGIGEKTVKMHRARLLAALRVATTADAIRIAVEAGIAPSAPD